MNLLVVVVMELVSRHRIGYERQGCARAIDVVLHRGRPAQPDRPDNFSVHLNGKPSIRFVHETQHACRITRVRCRARLAVRLSHHFAVEPTLAISLWPVTNDALLDESQMAASAMSSGLPMRPMGCMALICARNSGLSPAKR